MKQTKDRWQQITAMANFTQREMDITKMLAAGYTSDKIRKELGLSRNAFYATTVYIYRNFGMTGHKNTEKRRIVEEIYSDFLKYVKEQANSDFIKKAKDSLTGTQREIYDKIIEGKERGEIANEVRKTRQTVSNSISQIYKKFGLPIRRGSKGKTTIIKMLKEYGGR